LGLLVVVVVVVGPGGTATGGKHDTTRSWGGRGGGGGGSGGGDSGGANDGRIRAIPVFGGVRRGRRVCHGRDGGREPRKGFVRWERRTSLFC
jgi:hypothetical protein